MRAPDLRRANWEWELVWGGRGGRELGGLGGCEGGGWLSGIFIKKNRSEMNSLVVGRERKRFSASEEKGVALF
jgi:hypothetical protein